MELIKKTAGRAGLVACCWLLKLGLCGWISDPEDQSSAYENGSIVKVRKDTLMMVERAISVVRRRRSVKAIETYEQVKFLVEFVEYMRSSGRWRMWFGYNYLMIWIFVCGSVVCSKIVVELFDFACLLLSLVESFRIGWSEIDYVHVV